MNGQTIKLPKIETVMGVDFSGAAKSGKLAWIAELQVSQSSHPSKPEPLRLQSLRPVGKLAGSDLRENVCHCLVEQIRQRKRTLWGMDFPFGLPIELGLGGWSDQLAQIVAYPVADGDANVAATYGRFLVELAKRRHGKLHIRRQTDRETRTPFDCYHYRIIYQTYHGMHDVLAKIADDPATAVLPFQYRRAAKAQRLVVEACPASTLKRLGLPHTRYKQTGGRPPDTIHRRTRRSILDGIRNGGDRPLVTISDHRRRLIMNDPGGDALDAVLAGLGSWYSLRTADHRAIASDDRYPLEGRVYC